MTIIIIIITTAPTPPATMAIINVVMSAFSSSGGATSTLWHDREYDAYSSYSGLSDLLVGEQIKEIQHILLWCMH